MFSYPKQAEFNRVVPKNKIYAHARVSKRIKELFVAQVDEILWKYKLSPETVHLPARNGINEIQVFELALRTPYIDSDVLQSIDRAILFPLLFQLTHGGQVHFAASYKRPSESDTSKWVIEAAFQTKPQPLDTPRPPLPVALDLASLYDHLIRRHIPLQARPGEAVPEQVARFNALQLALKDRRKLQSALAREKQFNRKVELNAALRSITEDVQILSQP